MKSVTTMFSVDYSIQQLMVVVQKSQVHQTLQGLATAVHPAYIVRICAHKHNVDQDMMQ